MKKRLLLTFCLLNFCLGFSQITFSNFWNPTKTTNSAVVSANATYSCSSNADFYLYYSTDFYFSRGNVTTIPLGSLSSGNSFSQNITGLQQNTLYYWKVGGFFSEPTCAYNGLVGFESAIQSFTTNAPTPNLELSNYTFNNTLYDSNNNYPFSQNTSYVSDRNNNSNAALSIPQGTAASIQTLPMNNSTRSIALWYKVDANNSNYTTLYYYGSSKPNASVSLQIGANGNPIFNGVDLGGTYAAGVWRQIIFTHDGTNAKIYMNGVLLSTQTVTLETATPLNGNLSFVLGNGQTTTTVDDLKIYNYALSQVEVTSLYANNTLSTTNFSNNNLQASLYPNPTNDILNIQMEKELKTATIYTVLGNQVLVSTDKQINVSSLPSGNYFVHIEAVDGAVTTQKIIVKK